MGTMTISPLQRDYVTRKEFGEFKTEVKERFDDVEAYLKDGFKTVIKYCDNIDASLIRLEGRFDGLEGRFDGLEKRFDSLEKKMEEDKNEILDAIEDLD